MGALEIMKLDTSANKDTVHGHEIEEH